MRRGEAQRSPAAGTKEGAGGGAGLGGWVAPGQALTLSSILPASPTMAPWTAPCPCTLPTAPLLMRPSWGYAETAR